MAARASWGRAAGPAGADRISGAGPPQPVLAIYKDRRRGPRVRRRRALASLTRVTVTRSRLVADLRRLGVREGGITMVHTRMSAIGHVVGAAETVVRALLEALGPEGTLMAYASWEEHVYQPEDRPAEHRDAYLAEPPVFDVATAEVDRGYGRIPERVRTWPGAAHSGHPEAGVVAVEHAPELAHRDVTPATTATAPAAPSPGWSRPAARC